MSNIQTWDSGVGIVSEDQDQSRNLSIVRTVQKPKTYSTHERAARFGSSRNPAPIIMLDGSERWTPLPFCNHAGVVYLYRESA